MSQQPWPHQEPARDPAQDPVEGLPPGYAPVPVTNGKATASMITGVSTLVLSWCCGLGLVGLVAVFLGLRARTEIRLSGGAQSGDGLAIVGIVTGVMAVLVGLLTLVLVVLVVATGQAAFLQYGG